jgi:hypothetical protein
VIEVCLKQMFVIEKWKLKVETCLLEGLKGIVRELSFARDPEDFEGSFCCCCGAVANEECAKE